MRLQSLPGNIRFMCVFIEMMPIGCGMEFKGMSEEELTELLEKRFGSLTLYQGEPLGNGPSRYYEAQGFEGKLGFISAVSHKFCKDCNRIRLTSQEDLYRPYSRNGVPGLLLQEKKDWSRWQIS